MIRLHNVKESLQKRVTHCFGIVRTES